LATSLPRILSVKENFAPTLPRHSLREQHHLVAGENRTETVIAQREVEQLLQINDKRRLVGRRTPYKLKFKFESNPFRVIRPGSRDEQIIGIRTS
jgi:hypothetical protein